MKYRYMVLIGIMILASVIRVYGLSDIPNGLYQDETAIGYNAYSILTTGKDEYGKYMPLYFQSFGDWKLPVYVYATVPSIYLFGLNAFAVRLPSALFGIFSVLMMYFFTKELFTYYGTADIMLAKKKYDVSEIIALLSAGILAINPWHIHYSRATFEVSIALFLFLAGSTLLFRFIRKGTSALFFMSVLMFIVAMYSYNLTRLLSPLLFLWTCISVYTQKNAKAVSKKKTGMIVSIILGGMLLIPMLVSIFSDGGVSSASGTLIFSSSSIKAPLLELRGYMTSLPPIVGKLIFSTYIQTIFVYIRHIISYISVDFFFLHGSSHGNHGVGVIGYFYLEEIVFIAIGILIYLGIFSGLHKRMGKYLMGWAVITILVCALTREAPHATRSFFLLVPFTIASALGMVYVVGKGYEWYISNILSKKFTGLMMISVLSGIAVYSIVYFAFVYIYYFPVSYASSWRYADHETTNVLLRLKDEYDMIAVDPSSGYIYTSYLFYSAYPPDVYQKSAVYSKPDSEGFTPVQSFEDVVYVSRNNLKKYTGKKILMVTTKDAVWEQDKVLAAIKNPRRPVVFNVGQKIVSYPVEEIEYLIVEVNK